MVALQEDELPQPSIAVHVRVRLYSCPQTPGTESVTNVTVTAASQASMAVGVPKTGTEPHSIGLMTTGQVMTGAVLSSTTIVLLQEAEFPHPSMAVHVRVKVYSPLQNPGMESVTMVISKVPVQGSVILGEPKFGVDPHSTGLMTGRQVMLGNGFPCTTIVPLHEEVLPQASVAVQVLVVV
jgi:hypothetical protein